MLKISRFTGGPAATNAWLLESGNARLLVDAPEGVAEWLETRKVRVETLLLTHHHFDHVLDGAKVRDGHGARVHAFARLTPDLTLESLFRGFGGPEFEVEPFEVDVVLDGEDRLSVDGLEFSLLHVPGHSPDSLCFHLPDEGILFAGDTLFQGSIGRSDFPGGDGTLLVRGIRERILTLDPATRVYPGHGEETTVGEELVSNPFL